MDCRLSFVAGLKAAVATAETPFRSGVANAATVNAHTLFLPAWFGAIATEAVAVIRPKYESLRDFEYATLPNAEMVQRT